MQVWAVAAGSLVRVAGWDPAGADAWPELVRDPVVFAIGALTATGGPRRRRRPPREVDVDRGSRLVPTGFPALPARVNAARVSSLDSGRRGRAPTGARPFPRRGGGRGPGGRRCGPDAATTAPPRHQPRAAPGRARTGALPRGQGRFTRRPACRRRAGRDGGGTDQQPERGGCLLGDDAVADDLQLAGARDAGHPGHESWGMPIIHSANAADSRGRPDGPARRAAARGIRGRAPSGGSPARTLPTRPGSGRQRRRRGAQGRGRDVQAVAALVPVAGPASSPAVPVRRAAGVRGRQQPALAGFRCPAGPPWPARRWMITSGSPVCRLAPEGRTGPADLVRAGVAGHRGGQQGDRDGQRGADPVAVTAELLLPVPAGLPGRQGRPVVEVPGDRRRQQPRAVAASRAGRQG